ncbi:uncharacterized protein LOC123550079 [Mercenaria mercenaria]|uniref:uncharacterized protein LOC123550079 n=1 Tax=Mercenaria mercenaria TaxID=6596 RepID=UPI00234ECCCA|nr:uncharacterized protein LOC123550079 [Mercenaria mercenaria]
MADYIAICLLLCLALASCVEGSVNSCEDIDPTACSEMAKQNANLCFDTILSQTACPKLCGNCPMTCYNCNTTNTDVSSCNTVTCDKNKMCMVKMIQSTRTGQKRYTLGCEAEKVCDGGRKRTLHSRSVKIDCCDNDLCNTPLATKTSTSPPKTTSTSTSTTTTTTTPSTTTMPSTTASSTAVPTTVTNLKSSACSRDIIIMMDQSIPYSFGNRTVCNFLMQLVKTMDIGVNSTQVALSSFDSSSVNSHWELDRYIDPFSLSVAIATLSLQDAGITPDIYQPVHDLYTKYGILQPNGQYGDRRNVLDVAIIITGSFVNSHSLNTVRYRSNLLKTFMSVITIGIGGVDHQTLGVIAKDSNHALYINQLAELNGSNFQRKVLNLFCS